jgi:hypothetical protein
MAVICSQDGSIWTVPIQFLKGTEENTMLWRQGRHLPFRALAYAWSFTSSIPTRPCGCIACLDSGLNPGFWVLEAGTLSGISVVQI